MVAFDFKPYVDHKTSRTHCAAADGNYQFWWSKFQSTGRTYAGGQA